MLSSSPISTNPMSSIEGINLFYISIAMNCEGNLLAYPIQEIYNTSQFDCSANFYPSLYPVRSINVYHIVYVTTDIDYSMTLNTVDESTLYTTQDLNFISYIDTEPNYQLTTMMAGDFNMAVNNSSFDTTCYLTMNVDYILYITRSIDFIMNTVKEY